MAFGYKPQELDALTLREIFQSMRADIDRQRREYQLTASLAAWLINHQSITPPERHVKPKDLAPFAFDVSAVIPREEMETYYARHYARLERERNRNGRDD